MSEFEFRVELPDGRVIEDSWTGRTWEEAARKLLAARYPKGKIVAWRAPAYQVTTAILRGDT